MPFLRKLPNCYKVSVQQISIRGIPDILVCLNGYFVALEIKDVKGKANPGQLYNLGKIRDAGGLAMIIDRNSWPDDKEILSKVAVGRAPCFAEARANRPNFLPQP